MSAWRGTGSALTCIRRLTASPTGRRYPAFSADAGQSIPVWTTWRHRPRSDARRAPEGQQVASAATRAEHRGNGTKQHNGEDREGCDRGAGSSSIRGAARCFLSLPCSLRRLLFGLLHALLRLLRANVVLGSHQLVQAVAVLLRQLAIGNPSEHQPADFGLTLVGTHRRRIASDAAQRSLNAVNCALSCSL